MQKAYFLRRVGFLHLLLTYVFFVLFTIEQKCYTSCITKGGGEIVFIEIKANSDIAIYIQLANQLIEGIARGELKPGESLPSVRAFAANLGMNMHTVNKAYHYLEQKEFIQIVAKSGVIIQPNIIPKATADQKQQLADQIRPILAEGIVLKLSEEEMVDMLRDLVRDIKEGIQ
jgi:GntR family transcriptional regulator